MKILIYSKDNNLLAKTEDFTYSGSAMGEQSVTVTVKSSSKISFAPLDYLIYKDEPYVLLGDPTVTRTGISGEVGDALEYKLTFRSRQYELVFCDFLDYLLDLTAGTYYSGMWDFTFEGDVYDLARRIQANLNLQYIEGNRWTIYMPSADGVKPIVDIGWGDRTLNKESHQITVTNMNCWNALALAYSTFNYKFHLNTSDRNIYIGIPYPDIVDDGDKVTFEYGKGKGLYEINRSVDDLSVITRLRACGSDKNLPSDYLSDLNIREVYRLQLPIFRETVEDPYPIDYIEAEEELIEYYGMRPASVVFDDIFPTIEGVIDSNGHRIDEIHACEEIIDGTNSEGELLQSYFHVYLYDMGFDFNDHMLPEPATMSIKTGKLGAIDFEIMKAIPVESGEEYYNEGVRWKYRLAKNTTANTNYVLPSSEKHRLFEKGDQFVLINIKLPEVYILAAEARLQDKAIEYLDENSKNTITYTVKIDEIYAASNPHIAELLKEGYSVIVHDDDIGDMTNDEGQSRFTQKDIQSCTIQYKADQELPTYTIVLSDKVVAGQIDRIERSIESIKITPQTPPYTNPYSLIRSWEFTNPSDFNVYSAKASEHRYLNKLTGGSVKEDTIFEKDLTIIGDTISDQFGNATFTSGQFGSGFRIWKDTDGISHAEFDNLLVRREMLVSTLTIDEIKSVGGTILVSLARMECEVVYKPLPTTYRCYWSDDNGNIPNQFAVGDLAISRRWTGANTKYYWAKVTSVGSEEYMGVHYNYIDLSFASGNFVNSSGSYPATGDEIIQFGNATQANRRAAIVISAYGSDAPSIKQYSGIDSFDLTGKEVTVISPEGNKFTGQFNVTAGGVVSPVPAERGEWKLDATYYKNDRVSFDGAIWISLSDNNTTIPTSANYWRRETLSKTEVNASLTILDNKISSKVSQDDFNELGDIVSTQQTEINQNADDITLTISKIQSGSRNLIRKPTSANGWVLGTSWGVEDYSLIAPPGLPQYNGLFTNPIPVNPGDQFMLSLDVQSTIPTWYNIEGWLGYGINSYLQNWIIKNIGADDSNKRISVTFIVPETTYPMLSLKIQTQHEESTQEVIFSNIQLEPGAIATAWQPALEDITDITEAFYKFDLQKMSANRRIALGTGIGETFVEQAGISPNTDNVAFHAGISHDMAAAELLNPTLTTPHTIITHDGRTISDHGEFRRATIIDADIESGHIGGFEIANGRLGKEDIDTNHGMSLYDRFIRFRGDGARAAIGTNVLPGTAGYPALAHFNLDRSGSSYSSGVALFTTAKFPDDGSVYVTRRSIWNEGNMFSVGGHALFSDKYIGAAETNIMSLMIKDTHSFTFTSIPVELLTVNLPTRTQVNYAAQNSNTTFNLEIVIAHTVGSNAIRLRGTSGAPLLDNNCNYTNGDYGWIDMTRGDTITLKYCDGHYYIMSHRS